MLSSLLKNKKEDFNLLKDEFVFFEYYSFLSRYLPNVFKNHVCDKCVTYWGNKDGLHTEPTLKELRSKNGDMANTYRD